MVDALRKDPKVVKTLKDGLVEYLLDGLHADHKPRRFTEIPPPEASVPGTSSVTNPVEKTKQKVLVVAGRKAVNQTHNEIIGLEKDSSNPITQIPSYDISVCTDDSDLLVSGGQDFKTHTSTALVKKFCFATRSWISLPDIAKPVSYHGSACVNKKLYTFGGSYWEKRERKKYFNSVNVLDLTLMKWSACKPMSIAVQEPGIAVVDEVIFVIAGQTGKEWSTDVNKYDTRMDKWEKCQSMPKSWNVHRSTVAVNREVYVFGGSFFLQYNVDLDTWAELPLQMKPSRSCSMVLDRGRLIVSGGYENKQKEPNDRVQAYDIAQKTWSMEKYTMPLALCYHWTVGVNLPTS